MKEITCPCCGQYIDVSEVRADVLDECENYLIDSFNRANPNEMLSIGKVIEVFILLFNQLKENKNELGN